MKREILFRGKRMDNGEWIEGFLVKVPCAVCIGDYSPWWISVPPIDPDDDGGRYNIDPATVGQYTGLKDKTGKRIFEGDILNGWSMTGANDFRCKDIYWNNGFGGWYVGKFTSIGTAYHMCLEVIGNIHDNPELLEGGDHNE